MVFVFKIIIFENILESLKQLLLFYWDIKANSILFLSYILLITTSVCSK